MSKWLREAFEEVREIAEELGPFGIVQACFCFLFIGAMGALGLAMILKAKGG